MNTIIFSFTLTLFCLGIKELAQSPTKTFPEACVDAAKSFAKDARVGLSLLFSKEKEEDTPSDKDDKEK